MREQLPGFLSPEGEEPSEYADAEASRTGRSDILSAIYYQSTYMDEIDTLLSSCERESLLPAPLFSFDSSPMTPVDIGCRQNRHEPRDGPLRRSLLWPGGALVVRSFRLLLAVCSYIP